MIFQELLDPSNENNITVVDYIGNDIKTGRKRMKLHQLSWEEKIQRKKLRNRIAAQTSRDRKKARMDHLEEVVKELSKTNTQLSSRIMELQKQNESLSNANEELKKALSVRSYVCACQSKEPSSNKSNSKPEMVKNTDENCIGVDHFLEVPAESSVDPRQKGRKVPMQNLIFMTYLTVWKIFTLYLLTQKCWEISKATHSLMTLKNWQQACFKKLKSMKQEEQMEMWKNSPQQLVGGNARNLIKWWGKHQKNWNPVEVKA